MLGLSIKQCAASVLAVLVAVLLVTGLLDDVLYVLLVLFVICLGFSLGASMAFGSSRQYRPPPVNRNPSMANMLMRKLMEVRSEASPPSSQVVLSRNIQIAVQEILDFVTEDFILSWYRELGKDEERMVPIFQDEVWGMIAKLSEKISSADLVKLLAHDAMDKIALHFQDIRQAQVKMKNEDERIPFKLHSFLHSDEKEMDYLRKISNVLLINSLPEAYVQSKTARNLLVEILTCRVLKPAVDMICDPDYLNQKIFDYFDSRDKLMKEHKRTYSYAASYEDFVKMIQHCADIEHLKQMRYSIITEIMEATTINNLKKAKGIDTEKEGVPKGKTKGDLLRARNLRRYINQLQVAKGLTEKKIYTLGGPDYKSYTESSQSNSNIKGKTVFSFSVIMDNALARNYLMKYLRRANNESLLGYWLSVENMRHSDKRHWHQLASEIYQMFIASPSSVVKPDRTTRKAMEAFMLGDKGPDAFFKTQEQVYQSLEEHHYPSFIVSDIYHSYISKIEAEDDEEDGSDQGSFRDGQYMNVKSRPKKSPRHAQEEPTISFAEHSTYAQHKLTQLDDKIMNKTQALQALRSQKSDVKILKLQEDLQSEIESLRTDRRALEFHIDRTETWTENIGKWRANINNADVIKEGDKMQPFFVIVVLLNGSARSSENGWVISKKLADFHALHEQLVMVCPSLRKKELPTVSRWGFKSFDAAFLEKSSKLLGDYLSVILQDEQLAHSEAVFSFFSPSPEYLKLAPAVEKKSKFSLANLLKSKKDQDSDSDDDFLFLDDDSGKDEHHWESLAEPLFGLISEVFEMRGAFKWLRRTLMVFVQLTFGRNINRQMKETVDWLFSEPMLIYYIHTFRDSMWPNGKLAPPAPPRSDDEKLQTRLLAKEKFLKNMPDAVKNLFGEQNTKRGAIKMFEAFQNTRLNKHLFYVLLEIMMLEIFPQLKFYGDKVKQRLEEEKIHDQVTKLQEELAAITAIQQLEGSVKNTGDSRRIKPSDDKQRKFVLPMAMLSY